MKKIILIALVSIGTLISINVTASTGVKLQDEDVTSHSGRTNREGCHNDRIHGGYHCH